MMTTRADIRERKSSRDFVDSRWFSWLDLLLVLLAGAMWFFGQGRLTWQPLLVAMLPWGIRLAAGRFPFRRTPFEFPMLLFLISAAVGVWAAYNPSAAWGKFWLLAGAVLLFYALAGQPRDNLWPIVGFWGFSGLVVGGYFLLTHDWTLLPAKIGFVNQMLLRWMEQRPAVNLAPLPANVAASLMAISMPLLAAWGAHASFRNRKVKMALATIAGALIVMLLFLATSRGAWLATALAVMIGMLVLFSRIIGRRTRFSPGFVFIIALLAFSVTVGIFIALFPGDASTIFGSVHSAPGASDRYSLYVSTINLIRAFPITGSGLASFAGLYSQYILVIPSFFLPNGHNIFLDVALEQGPLGLVSAATVFLVSFALLATSAGRRSDLRSKRCRDQLVLRLAITTGLIIMLVHGLFEDTVYGSPFAMFLFALPGLAVAATRTRRNSSPAERLQGRWVTVGTLSLLLVLTGVFFLATGQPPNSAWQANLGSVKMAKAELTDWPTNQWDDGSNVAALEPARAHLKDSLLTQPDNRPAHYRLGLIAFLNRDFDEAVTHLEAAYALGGSHRGIRKALAFNYVWAGRFEEALPLMAEIPEARDEMSVYAWWWGTQGRDDLAKAAGEMGQKLQDKTQGIITIYWT